MKTKTTKPKPPRPFRNFPDELDVILHGYGPRARVVQLWRQLDGKPDVWTYLGRLDPAECEDVMIGHRFGGGSFPAKILPARDRRRRREEYFEHVPVPVDQQFFPLTAHAPETLRTE